MARDMDRAFLRSARVVPDVGLAADEELLAAAAAAAAGDWFIVTETWMLILSAAGSPSTAAGLDDVDEAEGLDED